MTVLQRARPVINDNETNCQSVEREPKEVFNPEGFVGSSGGTDIIVYCEDKFWPLTEIEIQTLVEVSEKSIANKLGGPCVSERIVDESTRVDVVGDLEEEGQE